MAQQREHVGSNKTGVQMSPFDTGAMLDETNAPVRGTPGDEAGLLHMRELYINESEGIGSVPMGIEMLKGDRPQVLLDKLAERLAFERTGARLYDALLTKLDVAGAAGSISHALVAGIRDDEARHMLLAKEAIEALGGDPTAQTPSADVAGVESMGLVQVLSDPRTSLAQSLHAILTAELSDNAGWEVLIALAWGHGQGDMAERFSEALQLERRHLDLVQTWYEEAIGLDGSVRPPDKTMPDMWDAPPGSTS
jgi:ferritin-like protein